MSEAWVCPVCGNGVSGNYSVCLHDGTEHAGGSAGDRFGKITHPRFDIEADQDILRIARTMCFAHPLSCHIEGRASCHHVGRCLSEFHQKDTIVIYAKAARTEIAKTLEETA